jgi:hypothetical protein
MQEPSLRPQQSILVGASSGMAFAIAMTCAGIVASFDGVSPLLPALTAAVVLAALERGLDLPSPHSGITFTTNTLISWGASFSLGLIGLMLLAWAVPASASFVCEPLVPWRISVILFGAFACAWFVEGLRLRGAKRQLAPLIHVGLGWIAPFYGFFHAPWFLAQSVAMPCSERPLLQCAAAAMCMALAGLAGTRTADWIFDSAP